MVEAPKRATATKPGGRAAPTKAKAKPKAPARPARAPKSKTAEVADPNKRWRPKQRSGPVCGYTGVDGKECRRRGAHYCEPRADHFVGWCRTILRHTAGPYARKPFILQPWQEFEICRPLFGEVVWSTEWKRYVRRYSTAYIIMARKNGKSELAAAIVLYMLVGDGEDSAEVYGAAKNTRQASKVYGPVRRMMKMSPTLRGLLRENRNERRIYDEELGGWYEVITSDADAELGHNPHLFILDEVLSQPNGELWDAMVTAFGARAQPLALAITTETNEPESFGASMIDEAEKVQEDPARAPHVFSWVRKTPTDVNPLVQKNWHHANPALGTFKSVDAMKKMVLEAKNDPARMAAFLQLQLNIRQTVQTRWLSLVVWDSGATTFTEKSLHGRSCIGGLDLASTTDMTAWVLRFPPTVDQPGAVLWRFWIPEAQLPRLNRATDNAASMWVAKGFLVATEGDWIDYEGDEDGRSGTGLALHPQIREDAKNFRILKVGYDEREAASTVQFMQKLGLAVERVTQGYGVSGALKEISRLIKHDRDAAKDGEPVLLGHGGHPVARYNVDSAEVRRRDDEAIKLVKPDREKSMARIDGLAALGNAVKLELDGIETPAPPAAASTAPDAAGGSGSDDLFRPTERLSL